MLTPVELEQFQQQGYLVFESLLDRQTVRRFVTVFNELVERGRALEEEQPPHWTLELRADGSVVPGKLHKVQGVCVVEPRVLEVARHPEIVSRVSKLVEGDLDVFGTKFFPKLPGGSKSTHWHQDNWYFGSESNRVVSCAIYYEHCDADNGCLRVLPGSHRGGIAEHQREVGSHGSWVDVDESGAVDVVCPAGTVVLFSANLLHGAYDNFSRRSRYSTAWHYTPTDLLFERFMPGKYADRHSAVRMAAAPA